ncbi:hypothetical protein N7540_011917 [Penicillium herquei]|nr:hypothetical protein N7540_011917 [Penicillium herquei]
MGIERWMEENKYCPQEVRWDGEKKRNITVAEIILFQFLKFTKDCYGVDMQDTYLRLKLFYKSFLTRPSAKRDGNIGEIAPPNWVLNMYNQLITSLNLKCLL